MNYGFGVNFGTCQCILLEVTIPVPGTSELFTIARKHTVHPAEEEERGQETVVL